jgi:hypothetical protein
VLQAAADRVQNGGSQDQKENSKLTFGDAAGRAADNHQASDQGKMSREFDEKSRDDASGGGTRLGTSWIVWFSIEHWKPLADSCALSVPQRAEI